MVKKTFREWRQEAEADPVYWTERAILSVTEEIFVAMEKRGMQRSELARRLGTSPAYVTKILRGEANFTLESLARIALALGGEFQFHFSPHDLRTPPIDSPAIEIAEPALQTPRAPELKRKAPRPRSKVQQRH
jgi:transcriptional regulator with XRE-family HTH domain